MRHYEPAHITVIRHWLERLIASIKVLDVVAHLYSEECITLRDKEEVMAIKEQKGPTNAADHLLTYVSLSFPHDCYVTEFLIGREQFLSCLKFWNQNELHVLPKMVGQ